MIGIHLVTPPVLEPITIGLVKSHLRLDPGFTGDDALLQTYISAARGYAEQFTKRAFYTQTWRLTLDSFPWPGTFGAVLPFQNGRKMWSSSYLDHAAIRLPRPTCLGVTSITYLDAYANVQTMPPGSFYVDLNSEPARIVPSGGASWPVQNFYMPGSVAVTFTTGTFVQAVTETYSVPPNGGAIILSQQANLLGVSSVTAISAKVPFAVSSGGVIAQAVAGTQVSVTYTYGALPSVLQLGLLMLVAYFYQNREAALDVLLQQIPFGINNQLQPWVFDTFEL